MATTVGGTTQVDLTASQNANFNQVFIAKTRQYPASPYDAVNNPNIPMDLTAYDIKMQIRQNFSSSGSFLDATVTNGKIIKGSATGVFQVSLVPNDLNPTFAGNADQVSYVYDIYIIDPSVSPAARIRAFAGAFVIMRDVTRI